jgi:hypothetical protein
MKTENTQSSDIPPFIALSNPLPPFDIIEAAEKVRVWMEQNGYKNWQLGGVCDRRFATNGTKNDMSTSKATNNRKDNNSLTSKCYYPDWEGGLEMRNSHTYGRDGFCCICGEPRRFQTERKGRRPIAVHGCGGEWLPISTAPKDPTIIDIWTPDDGRLTDYRREELSPTNVFYEPVHSGVCVVRDATHWMPIPEPPNK